MEDELLDHLDQAQAHAYTAFGLLYGEEGVKRPLWFRWMLGRAQSILMFLLVNELGRVE